jgi:hypothetical protein
VLASRSEGRHSHVGTNYDVQVTPALTCRQSYRRPLDGSATPQRGTAVTSEDGGSIAVMVGQKCCEDGAAGASASGAFNSNTAAVTSDDIVSDP